MCDNKEGTISTESKEQATTTDGEMTEPLNNKQKAAKATQAMEQASYETVIMDYGDDIEYDDYEEIAYPKLSSLEKLMFSYVLWDNCTHKTPESKDIGMYLGQLIFLTQLAKSKRGDKELRAHIKRIEGELSNTYKAIYHDTFK